MKQEKKIPQHNFEWKYSHEGLVCLSCGKVLISYHRHDYRTCSCENEAMIDGGQIDYIRYGAVNMDLLQPVIIIPRFYTKDGNLSKKEIKTYREVYSSKK